jgi:hypothetical protein
MSTHIRKNSNSSRLSNLESILQDAVDDPDFMEQLLGFNDVTEHISGAQTERHKDFEVYDVDDPNMGINKITSQVG